MKTVFKGEKNCQDVYKTGKRKGEHCDKIAYYLYNGKYFCGFHCKSDERVELKPNPHKKENDKNIEKIRYEKIIEFTSDNQLENKKGEVITTKLYMRKLPEHKEGFMSVFPNSKHEKYNNLYSLGMSSLSPMKMGPIIHFCPGVGPASSLENFWQGSKQYECETLSNGEPSDEYFRTRNATFLDSKPQRHKRKDSKVKRSIWFDKKGKKHYLQYVESRQVYCIIYEYFASLTKDFQTLIEGINGGMNFNIIGYDAHNVYQYPGNTLKEKFEAAYLDPKYPFGHEMCLQAMLLLNYDSRPWRKYHTINVFKT